MKTIQITKLISILLFTLLYSLNINAQNAEQTVREAANSINQKIEELHQLAAQKKIYKAIDKLDEINKEINKEITWGTFDEKFKEAKMENAGFSFNIRGDLPPQLEPGFWADYERRCDNIMSDQDIVLDGITSMVQLNNFDQAMAYGSQLKTIYETFKNGAENLGTANLPKFAYDLYGNMNDFIENYKKIEKAEREGIDIQTFEIDFNRMVSKARRSKELYNEYKRYIISNRIVIDDFKSNIRYINKLKDDVSSGPLAKLSYADNKYNWNYGPFQKDVEEACKDFEEYEIKCEDFKKTFEDIKKRARADWNKVKGNIFASDDNDKKKEFLDYHTERRAEFLEVVNPIFNKTYNKDCGSSKQTEQVEAFKPKQKKQEEIKQEEESQEWGNQQETVSDYNNLFTGSQIQTKVVPEKEPEPKKTSSVKKTNSNYISPDKYWENYIPDNTEREWIKNSNEYHVRFKVNGRTVGFRRYKDSNFKLPLSDEIMNNIAIKHGPSRRFTNYAKDPRNIWLSSLSFYRVNKRTGPEVEFEKDGGVRRIKYFIDDVELSEAEYKQKAKSDKSLAPYDIYKLSKWKELPSESIMPDPPEITNSDNLGFHRLTIPSQAVKFISASYTKNPDGIYYYEYYYLPNNTSENVGKRTWFISGNNAIITEEVVNLGRKGISRIWNPNTGELTHLSFKNRDKIIEGISTYAITVGPQINRDEVTFSRFNGGKCTRNEYISERVKYPQLPDPDIVDLLKNPPNVAPNTHPDPEWVNQDVTSMGMPQGSEIWRIHIQKGVSVQYFNNHNPVFYNAWHDREMTNPSYKFIESFYNQILYVHWYTNGKPQNVSIKGRVGKKYISCNFNEDGSIKSYLLDGRTGNNIEFVRLAYQGFINIPSENAHLSPNLKSNMNPPQIPQAEMTPMFKAIWGKEDSEINTGNIIASQLENSNDPSDKNNDNEADNYEQLQKQEFWKLLVPINEKLEAATKSFDKPYWEETQGARATDNPKQESLDIMRQAAQIAKQAKYTENEGALNYLITYKLLNFSGRVFAYKAKHEFFQLAAQLVVRSDQLTTKNRYLKEDLSEAYCSSAEVWREMTRKALWGDHAYNKMSCDKMVIQQYERAIQADPNNKKAKRILEQLKAPKKPVPAAVEKFEEIEPKTWNDAQTIMTQLDEDILERETKIEENFLQVADMTLEVLNGTVSIMRSGTRSWEKVTDTHVNIFVGDKIKTSADATGVSMTFTSDHTFLAIKNDAEIEVWSDSKLLIKRGGAYIEVTKKGNKFLVITPTCAVGVRGTEFEVVVTADKSTETYLYEGVVETRNGNDIAYLVPGQKIIAKKGEEKLEQSTFNANSRLASNWGNIDTQRRQHEQIKTSKKVSKPSKKVTPLSKKPKTNQTTNNNNSSPADIWSIKTYSNNMQTFKQQVTSKANNGFVPVGLNCTNSQFEVLFLGGDILKITSWNMEWYNDANSLQNGINNNMNQGYTPTGFSWNGSAYYVFYIMTDFTGQAWQIVPSALDLNAVTTAIQPYVEQKYVPMGITLFGDEYYTLLVQFIEPLADKWFIEGYHDNAAEIAKAINAKIPEASVPWGILKSGGVANILYIGF